MKGTERLNRVIVIGSSAGGLEALRILLGSLEPGIPAALVIVQHHAVHAPNLLPAMLERAGALPVVTAHEGYPLRAGEVLVAPPDRRRSRTGACREAVRASRAARGRIARAPRSTSSFARLPSLLLHVRWACCSPECWLMGCRA